MKKQKGNMPNVILVGFKKPILEYLLDNVINVLNSIGHSSDAIVTVIPADTKTCHLKRSERCASPYMIVRDTKGDKAKNIALALNEILGYDVEWMTIGGFLPGSILDRNHDTNSSNNSDNKKHFRKKPTVVH